MKKLWLCLPLFFLTACSTPNNSSSQNTSETPSSSSLTSSSLPASTTSTSSAPIEKNTVTLNPQLKEDQNLLSGALSFTDFQILTLKGEVKTNQQLELELSWQNLSDKAQIFQDIAKIILRQGGQELTPTYDDDYLDLVALLEDEDFEIEYRLQDTTTPLEIEIIPHEKDAAKKITVNFS